LARHDKDTQLVTVDALAYLSEEATKALFRKDISLRMVGSSCINFEDKFNFELQGLELQRSREMADTRLCLGPFPKILKTNLGHPQLLLDFLPHN
jgi:hypothetical protein